MIRGLVTGCNLKFLPGAVGLLRSVENFHPDVVRFCMVPPDDLDAVRSQMGKLAEVIPPPRKMRGVPDTPLLQLLAARAFISTFSVDVVAWVDSDVVFCRPAPELWQVPPGQVNAVKDFYNLGLMVPRDIWNAYARQFNGLKPDNDGFNAGIYALRNEDWFDLGEKYEAVIAPGNFPYYPPGFDQAVLNGLFHGRVNWLSRQFNALSVYEHGLPDDVRIIHFTANPKPWMPGYGRHNPGYLEWAQYGEQASSIRAGWLRMYYSVNAPRRLGYRAARKILTLLGLWRHEIGVSNGPPTPGP